MSDTSPSDAPLTIYQVDAFTDRPFAGNPAAVLPLAAEAPAEWMQNVAAEMNLSETAFLVPRHEGAGGWDLRWFTPATEVSFCGHATLASAHVLFETGAAEGSVRFFTRIGELEVSETPEGLRMDFPALPTEDWDLPPSAARALGVREAVGVGISRHDPDDPYALVEVATEEELRSLEPDFAALEDEEPGGWIVTARATETEDADFVSRFFCPKFGIDEDPVTGSAHCVLAAWWWDQLADDTGRDLVARQLSTRGGRVRVHLVDDRVMLRGDAVTVLRGELLVSPPE